MWFVKSITIVIKIIEKCDLFKPRPKLEALPQKKKKKKNAWPRGMLSLVKIKAKIQN